MNAILELLLIAARILGALLTIRMLRVATPFSVLVLVSLALALPVIGITPQLPSSLTLLSVEVLSVAGFQELLLGLSLGLPLALFLESILGALRLIDTIRGAQIAEQLLPGVEERTSLLETFGMVILSAVSIQSLPQFTTALYKSFRVVPIASNAVLQAPCWQNGLPEILLQFSTMLRTSCGVIAPLLITAVVLELGLLAASKAMPRVLLHQETQGIRLLLGLALLPLIFDRWEPIPPPAHFCLTDGT